MLELRIRVLGTPHGLGTKTCAIFFLCNIKDLSVFVVYFADQVLFLLCKKALKAYLNSYAKLGGRQKDAAWHYRDYKDRCNNMYLEDRQKSNKRDKTRTREWSIQQSVRYFNCPLPRVSRF